MSNSRTSEKEKQIPFLLLEKNSIGKYELISRDEVLSLIKRFGMWAMIKAETTMFYYEAAEDEWYPKQIEVGTRIKLIQHRPDVMPPFSSMDNFLAALGKKDPNPRYVRYFYDQAKKHGKFPWVQEPFEIWSDDAGVFGYVPLLPLLHGISPDTFEIIESVFEGMSLSDITMFALEG